MSLSISYGGNPGFPNLVEHISGALSRSPNLQSLDVAFSKMNTMDPLVYVDLATLLPHQVTVEPALKLKHLDLCPFEQFVYPSPACITSLSNLVSLRMREDLNGSDLYRDFWKAMTKHQVRLQVLETEPVLQEMVDYLESYSGLRELIINWWYLRDYRVDGYDKKLAKHNTLLDNLFCSALPKHQETLRSITNGCSIQIDRMDPGPWCLNEARFDSLLLCTRLEQLVLVVYSQRPRMHDLYPVVPIVSLFLVDSFQEAVC